MAENIKEHITTVPEMKLELVPVPVSDIDRAKAFYVEKVGFHADLDVRPNDTVRIVQLTPPGSACSIVISTGLPTIEMQTGSLRGLHLVVGDINQAREALISQGIKVLIISPVQAEPLTPIVRKVMEANIPVVTLDREVNTAVACRIGAENRPIGVNAGKFIIEKLNGRGNVIEIEGTVGASATIGRHDGFRDALTMAPSIRVVADQFCDYLSEPAEKFVQETLQRLGPGQIQAIYSHNDQMALAAMKVAEAAGRLKEITNVGIDGENSAFQAIKDGKLAATFTYPFCAPQGIQYAYNLAIGEQVPDQIVLKSIRVDASNVDQYLGKGF